MDRSWWDSTERPSSFVESQEPSASRRPNFFSSGWTAKGRLLGYQYNGSSFAGEVTGRKAGFYDISGAFTSLHDHPFDQSQILFVGAKYSTGRVRVKESWLPAMWEDGVLRLLPTANRGGWANAVNTRGDSVGTSTGKPMLWRQRERIELPSQIEGLHLSEAEAINDKGQVLLSEFDYEAGRLFLLSPKL